MKKILRLFICLVFLSIFFSGCGEGTRPTSSLSKTSLGKDKPTAALSYSFSLPFAISRESCLLLDHSSALLFGGINAQGNSLNAIYKLDLTNLSVTMVGSLALPTHDATSQMIGSNYFTYGGGASSIYSSIQETSLAQNINASSFVAGSLPFPLADLTSIKEGQTVFIAGGYNTNGLNSEILKSNDGAHFQVAGNLPIGSRYGAIFFSNNLLYLVGGLSANLTPIGKIQGFNFKTNKSFEMPLALPFEGAYYASIAGHDVIAGGYGNNSMNSSIYLLNPQTGNLSLIGDLKTPIGYGCSLVANNTLYAIGGENSQGKPVPVIETVRLN